MAKPAAAHERLERDEETPEGPTDRAFGLTVGGVLLAIGVLGGLWSGFGPFRTALAVIGGGLVGFGLVAPSLLSPLNRAWMAFAGLLHRVMTPVIMGLIFFVLFTPIAIGMRLFGRDALRMKPDPQARSYWIIREPAGPEPASMRDQF